MLLSRRNHGSSSLLRDATRAGNRIAEDALGVAQTARTELGGLGREVRDQAASGVTKARRGTARRLEGAAAAVDQQPSRRRLRKPLLLAVLAGVAGWIAVKVLRTQGPKADEKADELAERAEEKAGQAEKGVAQATEKAAAKAAGSARKAATKADEVRDEAHAHSGSNNAAH
jgi:hypothetical protein